MQQQLPPHQEGIYDVQQTKETADAVAYVFLTKDTDPVQYPFKFKPIGDEEVRVQITYTGLCQSDAMTVRNRWGPCNFPSCPGHEIVGYISKVGSKVTTYKIGDRVGCNPLRNWCEVCDLCLKGDTQLCAKREFLYGPYFGGYATHIQLLAKAAFRLPTGFNEELGSPLLCAGVTVHAPLRRWVKPNGTCAVIGIGGLGHLAVMYAAKMGMTVTAFTSSTNKAEECMSFGATKVSSSIDRDSLTKEQGKYDVVINTLAIEQPEFYKVYQRLTRIRGTYIQVGAPNANSEMKLDHYYIIMNQIRIAGSLVGSTQDTIDMLNFSAEHNIYPLCETFKFDEFPAAFKLLDEGRPKFRAVVNVIDWAKANGFEK